MISQSIRVQREASVPLLDKLLPQLPVQQAHTETQQVLRTSLSVGCVPLATSALKVRSILILATLDTHALWVHQNHQLALQELTAPP